MQGSVHTSRTRLAGSFIPGSIGSPAFLRSQNVPYHPGSHLQYPRSHFPLRLHCEAGVVGSRCKAIPCLQHRWASIPVMHLSRAHGTKATPGSRSRPLKGCGRGAHAILQQSTRTCKSPACVSPALMRDTASSSKPQTKCRHDLTVHNLMVYAAERIHEGRDHSLGSQSARCDNGANKRMMSWTHV